MRSRSWVTEIPPSEAMVESREPSAVIPSATSGSSSCPSRSRAEGESTRVAIDLRASPSCRLRHSLESVSISPRCTAESTPCATSVSASVRPGSSAWALSATGITAGATRSLCIAIRPNSKSVGASPSRTMVSPK